MSPLALHSRIVAGILMLLASIAAPAAPLDRFEARYEVYRDGRLAGEARLALVPLGRNRWEWTTRTRGTRGLAALAGLEVDERTVFRWRDGEPELIESTYDQKAVMASRHRTQRVDRKSRTIASFDGKRLHTLEYAPHTIDVHLATLALAASLARDARLEYTVATRDEIETYRYERVGREALSTALGDVDAVRVRRVREDSDRISESWFAPSLGWLPVRVVHVDGDGERIELRIADASGRPVAAGAPRPGDHQP